MVQKSYFFTLFICLLFLFSCKNTDDKIVDITPDTDKYDDATLTFTKGGCGPGLYNRLTIDSSGFIIFESSDFVSHIQYQLEDSVLNKIKSFYPSLDNMKDSYPGNCNEVPAYFLIRKNSKSEKTVRFISCASIKEYPELENLIKLITILNTLCEQIYFEKAAWEQLAYEFSTSNSIYTQGEGITFSCKITNPTDNDSYLFVNNEYQLLININNGTSQPQIRIQIPEGSGVLDNAADISKITLMPKESRTIDFIWDPKIKDYNGESYYNLPAGNYSASIKLMGAHYPMNKNIKFEVK